MKNISNETIEKLASLARIKISKEEKQHFSREISAILNYVDNLNKLDTKEEQEVKDINNLNNIYRRDEILGRSKIDKDNTLNREKILQNAPAKQDGYIKVKAILE